MKYLKNNLKVIIGFIVGVVLASSITVYAYSYFASDISYKKPGTDTTISVEQALNDLYAKDNTTSVIIGTNNKKYKLIDEYTGNTNQGYVPVLTSNTSSALGTASSNLNNAWYAFDNSSSTYVYYESENIATGYVQWSTNGVLMSIKKITASIGANAKTYNWYLQYLDMNTNNWVTINSGSVNSGFWNGDANVEGELETPIYTTSFRIYTNTTKTSGNNFAFHSLQAYP